MIHLPNRDLYPDPVDQPGAFVAKFPVIVGREVVVPDDLDETFGLDPESARNVADQVLQALGMYAIDTGAVWFSGYDNYDNKHHAQKERAAADASEGSYKACAVSLPKGTYEYYFTGAEALADGNAGPLAYAATGSEPVLGVYSIEGLAPYTRDRDRVIATPAQVMSAQVMAFRPTYIRPSDSI